MRANITNPAESTAPNLGSAALSASARELSIVVPLFNEEGNVGLLVRRLTKTLSNEKAGPYEIVLVDDGSRDGTWDAIREAAAGDDRIRGLRLCRNFGHQAALLAGLTEARGKAIVSMDGDLQHPPELIPDLLRAYRQGWKVVETRRRYGKSASLFKKLSSSLYYRIFSYLAEYELEEGRSDFRLIDAQVRDELIRLRMADLFLRGAVGWMGFPTRVVDFEADRRHSGASKYSLGRMLRFGRGAIVSFSFRPLKIGIALGLVTSAFALLELIYIIVQYFSGNTVPGWASTLGVISLLFGILFVILGIVGSYIARLCVILQNRPAFIIGEKTDG